MLYAYSIDDGASFQSDDMALPTMQAALDAAARRVQEAGGDKRQQRILIGEIERAEEWMTREMARLLAEMLERMQEDMVEDRYPCDMQGDVVRLTEQQTTALQALIADYLNHHGTCEGFRVVEVHEYYVSIRA